MGTGGRAVTPPLQGLTNPSPTASQAFGSISECTQVAHCVNQSCGQLGTHDENTMAQRGDEDKGKEWMIDRRGCDRANAVESVPTAHV